MSVFARKHWPLLSALVVLWATVLTLLFFSLRQNDGHLVYALDDPYIHMAMAKNFAQYGVWGVTRYEFSSSSSSLLWTLLLTLVYKLIGVSEIAPLALNIIAAMLGLTVVYLWLKKIDVAPPYTFAVLLSITFFAPYPSYVFLGMESILQALIATAFVWLSVQALSNSMSRPLRADALLFLGAPFVTMVRYEGAFLILAVCILFALRRCWLRACIVGVLGSLPIVIYGLISSGAGWFWVPNSLLLKKTHTFGFDPLSAIVTFVNLLPARIIAFPMVLLLFMVGLGLFLERWRRRPGLWEPRQTALAIYILVVLAQWYYIPSAGPANRYESYLVALGVPIVAMAAYEFFKSRTPQQPLPLALRVALTVVVAPLFAAWGIMYLLLTPQATHNIYDQQYQMGRFLNQFYDGSVVAANDVGAINFFADIKCLDLFGLASREVGNDIRAHNYETPRVAELARAKGVKLVVAYESWFHDGNVVTGGVPSIWIKVGQWTISGNVIAGNTTVSFYAVDPAEEATLRQDLKQFAAQLPPDVKQSVTFVE